MTQRQKDARRKLGHHGMFQYESFTAGDLNSIRKMKPRFIDDVKRFKMVQVKLLVIVLCVGGLKCCEVLRLLDFAADELWRVSWSLEATSMLPQHPTGLPFTDFSL